MRQMLVAKTTQAQNFDRQRWAASPTPQWLVKVRLGEA
jgi:hypothetical protein